MLTVQLYVANIPIRYVVNAARPHMQGGTAWEGVGFDGPDQPTEDSVVLRGSVEDKHQLARLQAAVELMLWTYRERTAFVELWQGPRYLGSVVWEAAPAAQAGAA